MEVNVDVSVLALYLVEINSKLDLLKEIITKDYSEEEYDKINQRLIEIFEAQTERNNKLFKEGIK